MKEIIFKQKQKRYNKRIHETFRKFLARSTSSDRPYIERCISAIKPMGIDDPGRLPHGTKSISGTKREAFFALLSRLIVVWWEWNRNPGIEPKFLAELKEVESILDAQHYLKCNIKGDIKEGFRLGV